MEIPLLINCVTTLHSSFFQETYKKLLGNNGPIKHDVATTTWKVLRQTTKHIMVKIKKIHSWILKNHHNPSLMLFQLTAHQQTVPSPLSERPGWWQNPYWWQSCLQGRWKWSIWPPSFLFHDHLCPSHSPGQSHSPSCSPLLSYCTTCTTHKTQITRFKPVWQKDCHNI